ncbi:hypothetical protein [Candidatus Albibeggiatoa sp. nov. BB20]|uniref:hypothetical protein n=1 Tax=Candidatus Albibeggiatoa sp. nov. BB20 TaxID=3162723 RepID=UPI0033654442
MLPIIQSLWIGDSLSVMEQLSIVSFLKNGHEFHLYIYDTVENVPKGAILKDANKIIPSSKIFKYKNHNSYAGFADLFRYKMLLENGHYWTDTDIVCLSPFDSEQAYVIAGQKMDNGIIIANNCLIKAPKNSSLMQYCYDVAIKKNSEELTWGETGPHLLTFAIKQQQQFQRYVQPPEVFCPISPNEFYKYITPIENPAVFRNSIAVHLWNEMWRRNNIDKSAHYHRNSMYEKLKMIYLT